MKKLVIGCGYLGLRVARKWLARGDDVYALTRSEERSQSLAGEGIQPVTGNVAQKESLEKLPEVETVLYSLGYDRFSTYSRREVLVDGLQNFLERMPASVNTFLFTSSISVYGQSEGEWVDEKSETNPVKENGQICLEAEELVRNWFAKKNNQGEKIDKSIFRLAGLYGPGRVFRKMESLKMGEPIGGEPDAWLNLTHVDDACDIILKREETNLENTKADKTLLLVCDDRPVTRREYYEELALIANAPKPKFDPALSSQQRGNGLNKRCNNRNMKEMLNKDLLYPDYREGLKAIFVEENPAD